MFLDRSHASSILERRFELNANINQNQQQVYNKYKDIQLHFKNGEIISSNSSTFKQPLLKPGVNSEFVGDYFLLRMNPQSGRQAARVCSCVYRIKGTCHLKLMLTPVTVLTC